MDISIKSTTPTITGVLTGASSALIPQDIEVVPSSEETVLTADEGHYIRSVTVKAIPSGEPATEPPTEGGDTNDNAGAIDGD